MRLSASALMTLAVAALSLPGTASAAQAQTVKVDYTLSLAGLSLGTAALSSTFEGSKYQLGGNVKLSGLARMMTGGKGAATAAGAIVAGQVQPTSFAVTAKSSSEERTLRMGLTGGNIAAIAIDPPYEEKPDRVPVKEADKRGVVDPMSALIMPALASAGLTDPAQCRRTIPVFDGAMRFNVVLSYGETKKADGPGYAGPPGHQVHDREPGHLGLARPGGEPAGAGSGADLRAHHVRHGSGGGLVMECGRGCQGRANLRPAREGPGCRQRGGGAVSAHDL
jgi:hypothetical protein